MRHDTSSPRLQEVCSVTWMGDSTLRNNRVRFGKLEAVPANEKELPIGQLQDSHCSPCSDQLIKVTEDKLLNIGAIHAENTTRSGTVAILAEGGHASNNIAIAEEVRTT